ncbi:amidohydrolase family protein [Pseudogemmatithrix spongiicola]|uniref:Amidohydrolase family protein n=1 Tax=Pseudogemmatithrix spongiicola TaxID=3062599 RepID=A0AA49JWA5_9BACT|nr:amidohydrolase family protein [Gemmatimonadaceae bacterium 'strain 138']WKW16252.1 amidohydrolase family protein [Gemmatimonadaceae bacterium 'strain 318']
MLRFVRRAFAVAAASALFANAGAAQLPQEVLAITRANVVDGVSDTRLRNATIVIRAGKIESIRENGAVPAGARVLDAAGRWVAPGLIDAHTHIRTVADARRALLSGVTTVRSASVPNYQDVALRDIGKSGWMILPDVLATGVFVSPDLGETITADARLAPLAGGVRTPEQLRLLVQVNAARGVNWIKTRGTERAGLPDTDPRQQTYTEAQLRVVVEEAAKANIPVMAHAHGDEGAYAAVRAGVKSIEHGTYLSDSTLRLMKERNVWLVPTLSTIVDLTTPGGDYSDPVLELRGQHMQPRIEDVIRRAHAMGVRIAAGADTDYHRESTTRISHEVMRFVGLGLTPVQALATATSGAAELLGVGNATGQLRVGYEADLIVLEHDPLANPGTLRDPLLVITNGRVALDRLRMGLGN